RDDEVAEEADVAARHGLAEVAGGDDVDAAGRGHVRRHAVGLVTKRRALEAEVVPAAVGHARLQGEHVVDLDRAADTGGPAGSARTGSNASRASSCSLR